MMISICRSCLRGIYSCQWSSRNTRQRYDLQRGPKINTCIVPKRDCCWFSFLSFVSILALSWMYVCFIAFNDRSDLNEEAFKSLKKWVNWYVMLIIFFAVQATYCLLLLVFGLLHLAIKEPLNLHWLHKVLLFFSLITVTLITAAFSVKWKAEWQTVYLSFQATAPFLQLGAVVALTVISWIIFQSYHLTGTAGCKVFILLIFLLVSVAVFLCPLAICSPCIIDSLPSKPALVGHRGAPMLVPENTLTSFRKSLECGVVAFETDVQMSKDKKPFLMHDYGKNFLLRTTDVKEKFPGREDGTHTNFTIQELQTLNAGEWFLRTDPFWSVSSLSEEEKMETKNQTVPSLSELLVMAKAHNVSLIFDLKNENNWTGFNNSDSFYTHEAIKNSGISPEKIWWLPQGYRHNLSIKSGYKQVYNNQKEMEMDGGNFLNLNYNSLSAHKIRELRGRNVSINLWGVNERWLFSLVWCSGASSVTTNACHIFRNMSKPDWHLEPNQYKAIWISADVISLLLMFGLFFCQSRRKRNQIAQERGVPLLPH